MIRSAFESPFLGRLRRSGSARIVDEWEWGGVECSGLCGVDWGVEGCDDGESIFDNWRSPLEGVDWGGMELGLMTIDWGRRKPD